MKDKSKYRFDAFISYYQNPDKELAKALVTALQKLGQEWYLLKFRALEIFRDETGTSGNEGLEDKILKGIKSSNFLIILASNKGKIKVLDKKDWVSKEVNSWLKLKEKNKEKNNPHIIICITDGIIVWDDSKNDFNWDRTNCLPMVLQGVFKDQPKWIDLRNFYDENSNLRTDILKLDYPEYKQKIAEISSEIQGISVDELIAQDRNYKRIGWGLIVFLFIGISLLGLNTWKNKNLAIIERDKANKRLRQVELLQVKEFVRNAQIFKEAGGYLGNKKAKEMKINADSILRIYPHDFEFAKESKKLNDLFKLSN